MIRPANLIPSMLLLAALAVLMPRTASAHFIWLVSEHEGEKTVVNVYFGEEAIPDDPDLLGRLDGMILEQLNVGSKPANIELSLENGELTGSTVVAPDSLFIAKHDFGVLNRGDAVFRLKYYAKGGPAIGHAAWTDADTQRLLPLDVVPTLDGDTVHLRVRFNGELIEGAQVVALGPGLEQVEATTDDQGLASFKKAKPGLYSIRARHIENEAGEVDGKKYNDTRHYSTVAVEITEQVTTAQTMQIPPLPEMVTSFGGAILDDHLYIYGGHTGSAHSYSLKEQGNVLRRVALGGGEWEALAEGPHLQGLALVAYGEKLYRIGGFTAKNAEGEDHDLWSQNAVAAIDPEGGEWIELPALPEPRSSHDAAVVGDTIYVVGGWELAGGGENEWHKTAWAMDLSAEKPEWKALPEPPFQRRALALAAHEGKLYAIGGMQPEGGPTTRVDIFDPASGEWKQGPNLVGEEDITGFGSSAFATGGRLYVTTIKGDLQRLTDDGSAWEIVKQTPTARFFHRMLPIDDKSFVIVGGANMKIGKFDEVEVIDVTQ